MKHRADEIEGDSAMSNDLSRRQFIGATLAAGGCVALGAARLDPHSDPPAEKTTREAACNRRQGCTGTSLAGDPHAAGYRVRPFGRLDHAF